MSFPLRQSRVRIRANGMDVMSEFYGERSVLAYWMIGGNLTLTYVYLHETTLPSGKPPK